MRKNYQTIEVTPVKDEVLSAKEYLRLAEQSPHLIAHSRFIPPEIGQSDFGRFKVLYTVPIMRQRAAA